MDSVKKMLGDADLSLDYHSDRLPSRVMDWASGEFSPQKAYAVVNVLVSILRVVALREERMGEEFRETIEDWRRLAKVVEDRVGEFNSGRAGAFRDAADKLESLLQGLEDK